MVALLSRLDFAPHPEKFASQPVQLRFPIALVRLINEAQSLIGRLQSLVNLTEGHLSSYEQAPETRETQLRGRGLELGHPALNLRYPFIWTSSLDDGPATQDPGIGS